MINLRPHGLMTTAKICRNPKRATTTRRDFLKLTAGAVVLCPFFSFPERAIASQPTLKIAKWAHFLPEFDLWFEGWASEWGRQHELQVRVDEIPVENIYARAKAEASAGEGHDIFIFPWPPAEFQQSAINHSSVYQLAASKYGSIPQIAHKSTFDFKTKKYFAVADSWIPTPLLYLEDFWQQANMPYGPLTYTSLRSGGQRVRDKVGIPCGLAMTSTLEGNITCNTILYAFGGTITNRNGEARIDGRTTTALSFAKALYNDAGTPDEVSWRPGGNLRSMLSRKVSCTMGNISLLRMAEKQDPALAAKIRIQPPLLGSYGVTAFPSVTNCSVVWEFAKNQDSAKQFLADMIDQSKAAFEKSQGCNFPTYQKTLPDLLVRLENDNHADPPSKYKELKDALHWTPNLGAPGFVTPAWMETFNTFVIPRMFRRAVQGELSVLDAARAAEVEMKQIAEKWTNA
jgi:multiple sugar transport system substrate-binding protein